MAKRYLTLLLAASLIANVVLVMELSKARIEAPNTDVVAIVEDVPAPPTLTSGESYPFIRVVDGDTITVGFEGDIEYVRLIGIDAPETNDPGGPECYATEATEHLKELMQTGTVSLHFDETQGERDKYNRLLAYVELPDGTDLGKMMLQDGYAQEAAYGGHARVSEYEAAEAQAASAQRGLWSTDTCN